MIVAINETLSHLSDLAFSGAVAGYATAMVCHGVEFALGRSPRRAAAEPAAVASRGGTALLTRSGGDDGIGHVAAAAPGPRVPLGERFGRAAVLVTVLGFAAHVFSVVTRGMAVHRWPWGNMYEFSMMITGAAVAGWLVVLWRTRMRSIGVFVLTPITALVFLAGTVLYTQAGPLLPALHSYWIVIHVAAISLSSGVLMLSGIGSALYLLRDRYERRLATGGTDESSPWSKLPPLDKLDRVAYRSAIGAFPVYTFAIIAGALWAEVAWGAYWSWDPKETVALVTWIIYAGYLHARATAGWRGRWSAWISVVGLVSIVFNLFFVNMVISGLHSYAGLN